jgi:hypothetical protein
MSSPALHHRCWNHESREAVCRCPECSRSYCRECVTEHQARLLCAECLRKILAASNKGQSRVRKLYPAAMALAGLLLAWGIFYTAGQTMVRLVGRIERSARSTR